MEVLFKIIDVFVFVAVAFVSVAALVTAVRCKSKPGNTTAPWILFLGCLIGALVSFAYLVMAFLPPGLLYDQGVEVPLVIYIVFGMINLVSTAVMAAGVALFRPRAAKLTGGAS